MNGPFFVLSSVYVAVISPVLIYHFSHLHHRAHFIAFETEQTKIRQLLRELHDQSLFCLLMEIDISDHLVDLPITSFFYERVFI